MVCVHAYSTIIKITIILCDFMADNLWCELTVQLTKKNVCNKHSADKIKIMAESVIILTLIDLKSRGKNAHDSLTSLSIIELLRSNFHVGTEKAKVSATYDGLCPLQ